MMWLTYKDAGATTVCIAGYVASSEVPGVSPDGVVRGFHADIDSEMSRFGTSAYLNDHAGARSPSASMPCRTSPASPSRRRQLLYRSLAHLR